MRHRMDERFYVVFLQAEFQRQTAHAEEHFDATLAVRFERGRIGHRAIEAEIESDQQAALVL